MNKLLERITCKGCNEQYPAGEFVGVYWSDLTRLVFCSESCATYWRENSAEALPVLVWNNFS